ncbi:Exodeoxyribonuclease V alpha chain [Serinicoccus hydrothermalis]|uniref:RecBCD enzyme subunit RecD n=1 Tax=Serinicoccus hydrothermalis TaxID=1758689 RepID=A0A1B1NE92_9MICO|nr:exodeoxyribonuclease V subunit alpha [Serinicoccus hydrothermalis]ANS79744.1 Exodeoxyribonuclease V alpha chain [Serinicoccus hydrothermalis]
MSEGSRTIAAGEDVLERAAPMIELFERVDDHDRRLALTATGPLRDFNRAGLLTAADVHVATGLARAAGEKDAEVLLAAAVATRAVRSGSVAVDLAALATEGAQALPDLPWPDPQTWTASVAGSRLAREGGLVVEGTTGLVYLQRYHHQEVQVVADLRARAELGPPAVDEEVLQAGLERIFPGAGYAEQRLAADVVVRSRTGVITGGPGTGKTTTVAGVLTLLAEQAAQAGEQPLRVGLAAPTGKAAARVKAAVDRALDEIEARAVSEEGREVVQRLRTVEPRTLHRLLGWRPGSRSRFRHHRGNRLPHDVVLVDEASMVSLTHMARLLEALRPSARLILVGDADQLVSVEAGAVLADLVAAVPEREEGHAQGDAAGEDGAAGQASDDAAESPGPGPAPLALARLRTVHRFGETIGALAQALRVGDADAVVSALSVGGTEVEWVRDEDASAYLQEQLTRQAREIQQAARRGDDDAALRALHRHRLLCAHREGERGVRRWNHLVETWLAEDTGLNLYEPMYLGRPLLVTANDYATGVLNGDTGVVVASQTSAGVPVRMAAIDGAAGRKRYTPSRLGDVETMHAMTIHKAQGSQAEAITVLLPELDSPLLTRELFYTAVTRAERSIRVVGSEEEVRAAVQRRVVRASGLRQRLGAGPRADDPRVDDPRADDPAVAR